MTDTIRLSVAYRVTETVYLASRNDPLRGVVTGYVVRSGHTKYIVGWGDGSESDHFDFELTDHYEPHYHHGPKGGDH